MEKGKLNSRQVQAINTRNNIYNIAFELMKRKGFNNITIEDISEKAGVSVGAFYHYFNSKNDILFEVYRKADEYFKENVANKIVSEDSLDQIVEFFLHYARYNKLTGIDFTKILYNTENKLFIQQGRFMQVLLRDIIGNGQGKNEITLDMTSDAITDYLFIAVRGVIFDWCLHDGDYDIEDNVQNFVKRLSIIFKN